jgi:hypothetical protein
LLILFFFTGNDRLPYHIRDGVCYVADKARRQDLQEMIQKEKKRARDATSNEPKKTKGKKVPEMYLVNSKKAASEATEEEMSRDLTEDDLGTDDAHRILQCKIRYR